MRFLAMYAVSVIIGAMFSRLPKSKSKVSVRVTNWRASVVVFCEDEWSPPGLRSKNNYSSMNISLVFNLYVSSELASCETTTPSHETNENEYIFI